MQGENNKESNRVRSAYGKNECLRPYQFFYPKDHFPWPTRRCHSIETRTITDDDASLSLNYQASFALCNCTFASRLAMEPVLFREATVFLRSRVVLCHPEV